MIVDQAVTAWESMLTDANDSASAVGRRGTLRGTLRGHAVGALRTTALLVLAALAILVLLPAALAAATRASGRSGVACTLLRTPHPLHTEKRS